ncbi:MAG: hypothetical protein ACXVRH_13260 [Thermoleophilaceae bacterium]
MRAPRTRKTQATLAAKRPAILPRSETTPAASTSSSLIRSIVRGTASVSAPERSIPSIQSSMARWP